MRGQIFIIGYSAQKNDLPGLGLANTTRKIFGSLLLKTGKIPYTGSHGMNEIIGCIDVFRNTRSALAVLQVCFHNPNSVTGTFGQNHTIAVAHTANNAMSRSQQHRKQTLTYVPVGSGKQDIHEQKILDISLNSWSKSCAITPLGDIWPTTVQYAE